MASKRSTSIADAQANVRASMDLSAARRREVIAEAAKAVDRQPDADGTSK